QVWPLVGANDVSHRIYCVGLGVGHCHLAKRIYFLSFNWRHGSRRSFYYLPSLYCGSRTGKIPWKTHLATTSRHYSWSLLFFCIQLLFGGIRRIINQRFLVGL